METTFLFQHQIQSVNKSTPVQLQITDSTRTNSFAHLRLVFKQNIALGTELKLLNTIFIAAEQTTLPYSFNIGSPATSLQTLLQFYQEFNDYNFITENNQTLNIIAKHPGQAYLPNPDEITASNALNSVTVIEQGEAKNPLFNLENTLVITYTIGIRHNPQTNWAQAEPAKFKKHLSFLPDGIHPIPTNVPILFPKVPKTAANSFDHIPMACIQLTAFNQHPDAHLQRLVISEPIFLLPNFPENLPLEKLLPNPFQQGTVLNASESNLLIENAPPIPLYFIVPWNFSAYTNPFEIIELQIKTTNTQSPETLEYINLGNSLQAGLYCYWLSKTNYPIPDTTIQVALLSGNQVLYKPNNWVFNLIPNTAQYLSLGYLNPFGLPTILNIPLADTQVVGKVKRLISKPLPFQKEVINQWTNSPDKWQIINQHTEIANTITSIQWLESTDNLLTLILETNGK